MYLRSGQWLIHGNLEVESASAQYSFFRYFLVWFMSLLPLANYTVQTKTPGLILQLVSYSFTCPTRCRAPLIKSLASSIYQSNGKCFDACVQNYAFAIVQYQKCWCSNYIPARTTSTGSCNQDCPGYPDEQCGSSSAGLFGYIALSKSPSGTLGASSNSPSPSVVVVQSSTQVVSTKSPGMVLPTSSPSLSQASSITTLAASQSSSPPFLGLIISSPISISTSQVSSLTFFLTSLVQKSLPDPSPVTVQKTVTASPSVQISIVSIVSSLVCLNPSRTTLFAFAILHLFCIRFYLGMTVY